MFLDQEITVDLGFLEARARLINLTRGSWFTVASGEAFSDGRFASGLLVKVRAGLLGEVPLTSELATVKFLAPEPHDHIAVVPLRWEATLADGRLFPVLDADIALLPVGEQTRIVLSGSYRLPPEGLRAAADELATEHVAVATVNSLLRKIAQGLCADLAVN
ncbi:MAG TPA: hypothetical protein VG253_03055 [Streptosporangiaceae bacterium]|nr:hypothetical protein [Streptosporangiaceae bacterium]